MVMQNRADATAVARFRQNGSWHVVPGYAVLMRRKNMECWRYTRARGCLRMCRGAIFIRSIAARRVSLLPRSMPVQFQIDDPPSCSAPGELATAKHLDYIQNRWQSGHSAPKSSCLQAPSTGACR